MNKAFTEPQHTSDRRTTAADVRKRREALADVPVTELLQTHMADDGSVTYSGRAMAAVHRAMGSDSYSDEDRIDVAAEIVAALLAHAAPERRRRATDSAAVQRMLRWIDRAELTHPGLTETAWVPAHLASVTRMYNLACTLRRSIDRQRDRDTEAAGMAAAADFTPAPIVGDDPETIRTPEGAARAALAALAAVGVRSDSNVRRSDRTGVLRILRIRQTALLRAVHGERPAGSPGRSVAAYLASVETALWRLKVAEIAVIERRPRWTPVAPLRKGDGPAYTLAYSAARASAGLESREIAAELAVTFGTLRNHLSGAARTLRYRDPLAWAEALSIIDSGGCERPRVVSLPESNGVRILPGHSFPNATDRPDREALAAAFTSTGRTKRQPLVTHRPSATVSTAPPRENIGKPTRKPWADVPLTHRRHAAWADGLPIRSHSRLSAAAVIARKRSALKTDAQRQALRAEVGLPVR